MNNYDQRVNDRADQHLNMMHRGSEYDAMKGLAGSKGYQRHAKRPQRSGNT